MACRASGPGTGNAAAENRWTQHGGLEAGAPADMAAGQARYIACRIEPGNGLEMLVQHAACEIGLHAAEVLARQGKDLNGVIRRCVERLRQLQRLAEFRLAVEPFLACFVVALDSGKECRSIDLHSVRQLCERLGLADEG